jgi:hypothetical protein
LIILLENFKYSIIKSEIIRNRHEVVENV